MFASKSITASDSPTFADAAVSTNTLITVVCSTSDDDFKQLYRCNRFFEFWNRRTSKSSRGWRFPQDLPIEVNKIYENNVYKYNNRSPYKIYF